MKNSKGLVLAFFLICCAYLHAEVHFPREVIPESDARMEKADLLLDAGLYQQAIELYGQVLKDHDSSSVGMQARFHQGQAFFSLGKYSEAIEVLKAFPATTPLRDIFLGSKYLLGMSYRECRAYTQAKDALTEYLNLAEGADALFYDRALFELGRIVFLEGDYNLAKMRFQALCLKGIEPRLHLLAELYLARILLIQNHPWEAAPLLASIAERLPEKDPLRFELAYLQGEMAFLSQDYFKAAESFEKSLPLHRPELAEWYGDALYQLGWSYLKMGEGDRENPSAREMHLKKSEEIFNRLLLVKPSEKGYLALGQCYLVRAARLNQQEAYAEAETLLSRREFFLSAEAQAHALLLLAAAAPSYSLRDKFYRQITQESQSANALYSQGWQMRGINDFEQGLKLKILHEDEAKAEEAGNVFARAACSFGKAFDLLKNKDPIQAQAALKYQALALSYSQTADADTQAFDLLDAWIKERPPAEMAGADEILYLHGFFAARLAQDLKKENEIYAALAEASLKKAAAFPRSKLADRALLHLGAMHFRKGNYSAAEQAFLDVAQMPLSPLAGEAWYWAACCADQLQLDPKISRHRRRQVIEGFADSPFAPEAYFTFFSYADYLQGDKQALRHLQNFVEKYPLSPFILEAYSLIGWDFKRDRKTAEGKWIRKKNLTEAINAFHQVETAFDLLVEKERIPQDRIEYYLNVRMYAILERAKANLAIALESQGAKRQIYLEYAEEVFKNLIDEFKQPGHPYAKWHVQEGTYSPLYEESAFWLAQTYIKGQDDLKATSILDEMLSHYSQVNATRGYMLSRVWIEKGKIEMRAKDPLRALALFKKAEDASKGNILGTDQRLDLWIQQSLCCRSLGQYDQAILILSQVVNDDAVSSLRLKAMYLRAEAYELQGRRELSRKQLESISKKGGVWAQKAQEKLEKDYGY